MANRFLIFNPKTKVRSSRTNPNQNNSNEVRLSKDDSRSRVIKLVKERLLENETVKIVSSHLGAPLAIQVAHFLEELGYLTVSDLATETVLSERKLTGLVVSVTRTSNFKNLYDSHEAELAKRKEEVRNPDN